MKKESETLITFVCHTSEVFTVLHGFMRQEDERSNRNSAAEQMCDNGLFPGTVEITVRYLEQTS